MEPDGPAPDHIMELGLGFQASKTTLAAVTLGVFDSLADGPKTRRELERELGLHPRGARDFLDALVALDLLEREDGRYRNTAAADAYLVPGTPSYLGGFLQMANDRLYPFWDDLEAALQTGETQNELEDPDTHPFEGVVYHDDAILEQFVGAMTGLSLGVAEALAHEFPWDDHETVVDLGASEGVVPKAIAEANDHIEAIGVDLPRVEPHFRSFTSDSPAADRLTFETGDFFGDEPLPPADVYVLGHILHDWGVEDRREILAKVADAVRPGGAVIVYGTMIDEERRENATGLLMSLNMLIETPDGFDYTPSQCLGWLHDAGFEGGEARELPGPETMVVARR
ncbi:acetylserotonin O-methyltransferase [Haloarcula marina]|uniref:acetylserotonin O-methyltransferase n=1 Tax=Haloarcula marina TaxID=2961574 RepID=UPI0020B70C7F|nr:acetylserotonin O-methyltransferase [Halomicroarcula marina]